jgi:hypothetical protein
MNVRETRKKCKRMVQKSGHVYAAMMQLIVWLVQPQPRYFNYCESIKTKKSAAEKE